ncbi:MAG TPA: hypothetical protein VEI98_13575 [Xanthobacteraceae bacterium]|nr:hypothetical protein [Xanthobacteraceae bacterium]
MFKAEECLEKVTQYEDIARTEDQEDIRVFYLALAEHWRTLAQIAAQKTSMNRVHALG